jgi:hypothetical protein
VPNSPSQQLAYLRELLNNGFYEENLDRLVACCSGLAQDSSYVLPFFVLKNVFREMSSLMQGVPVNVEKHNDLISELAEPIRHTLVKITNNDQIDANDLEAIVRVHLRNASVFRLDQG